MKIIQNIKYIAKSSLVLVLASSIVYAAGNISLFTGGDILTETRMNEIVTEINTLKGQVSTLTTKNTNLQNQINTKANSTSVYSKSESDNLYYTKTKTQELLALKANSNHLHDNRYYTEGEINTKVTNLQNQINTINVSGNGIVTQKSTTFLNSSSRKNWNIGSVEEPLIIGKPVILTVKGDDGNAGVNAYFRVLSGTKNGYSNGNTRPHYIGTARGGFGSSVGILIPTKTIITVSIRGDGASWPTTVYAHQ